MKIRLTRGRLAGIVFFAVLFSLLAARRFKAVAVEAETVTPRNAVETVLATGRVVGERTIPLSFARAGLIAEETVKEGDRAEAGDVLMKLDQAVEETTVAQRRAALAAARIQAEKIRTTDLVDARQKVRQARAGAGFAVDFYARQKELSEQSAVSRFQLDQADRDREQAEAALEAAENGLRSLETTLRDLADIQIDQAGNDLRRAEIDLRDTILRAPFDGRVVEYLAHKGEFVPAGRRVITFIPETARTFVEIQVDEVNAGRIAVGQRATVSSPAFPGAVFPAAVERIASIVDVQRGTFAVRLMMDRLEAALLPESAVSVQIVTGETAGVLLLEERFVIREGGAAFVFRAEGRRSRRVRVEVRDLGNGLVGILSGLEAGDRILSPQGLSDGTRFRLASPSR